MRSDYTYDVFISFTHEDTQKVHPIYEKMKEIGLKVFWSERTLEVGKEFTPELEKALKNSQHFALYCSKKATKSKWVRKELDTFLNSCHMKDQEMRRMYVLKDETCPEQDIPDFLKDIHRPRSVDQLIAEIIRFTLDSTERELTKAIIEKDKDYLYHIQSQLEQAKQKVEEARDYYRHNRFWRPIAENRDIHIFTCGRDIPHDPKSSRGYGGRTNIDVWDYRAVLDITHFFASNYPNTKVTIEDPMSKLHGQDIEQAPRLASRIAHMRSMLENKDSIIIGSPDVNDFAEIVLAEIHQVAPYTESREKSKGFVIIKERKHTKSSFYWEKGDKEQEGVAQILNPGNYEYFPHILVSEDRSPGKMYGILVVANNPFCKDGLRRKVIILSGFSGVTTNVIAKILTDERWLHVFFALDYEYTNIDRNVEALFGVKYIVDRNFAIRDTRRIADYKDAITFEKLVEI